MKKKLKKTATNKKQHKKLACLQSRRFFVFAMNNHEICSVNKEKPKLFLSTILCKLSEILNEKLFIFVPVVLKTWFKFQHLGKNEANLCRMWIFISKWQKMLKLNLICGIKIALYFRCCIKIVVIILWYYYINYRIACQVTD